jgi:SRSO17 transposase
MTQRLPVTPAPIPLERYAQQFDDLFSKRNQRECFRRYLEGLLLPSERNKTLTALAHTEPGVGAQQPRAQQLQWFLSEANWDLAALTRRRIAALRAEPVTAPNADGVLIVDETGDRKDGSKTAHVGRQYLANLGKIDNGVVSVNTVWADPQVYYPLEVEPYTPAHHFPEGQADPAFRTKPQIARELVERAVALRIPFRAVVADSFYGEHAGFIAGLEQQHIGYVVAVKPSHAWWHPVGSIGSVREAAEAAGWQDQDNRGQWLRVERVFRDGHTEPWWALEVDGGPYGPDKRRRAVVVTTDPATLPERTSWYLVTNLPAPSSAGAASSPLAPASLPELVQLYGLRIWVEQSYKQVKTTLGWSQYQVRSDQAMRRHWELVCAAFCFCWWAHGRELLVDEAEQIPVPPLATPTTRSETREKNPAAGQLAGGAAARAELAGALEQAQALVAGVVDTAATARGPGTARASPGRNADPALR